jgi:hypothetical protein
MATPASITAPIHPDRFRRMVISRIVGLPPLCRPNGRGQAASHTSLPFDFSPYLNKACLSELR